MEDFGGGTGKEESRSIGEGLDLPLRISVGVLGLTKFADRVTYEAKRNGKGRSFGDRGSGP